MRIQYQEKKWENFHKHVEIKLNTSKQSMNKTQGKQNKS